MNVGSSTIALRIQNNMERLNVTTKNHIEKLASGLKINRASDDAAGLRISEKMRSQIRGLDMSINNATDGISMLQTADGGLSAIGDLLQRMHELTVKAQNGIHTIEDQRSIANEYEQCKKEIDRIAETTTFNGKHLLNESSGPIKVIKGEEVVGDAYTPAHSRDKIDFSTVRDGTEFIVKIDEQKYHFTVTDGTTAVELDSTAISINKSQTNYEKAEMLAQTVENKIGTVAVEVYKTYPDDGKQHTILIFADDCIEGQKISMEINYESPVIKIGNSKDDVVHLEFNAATTKDLEIDQTNVQTVKNANIANKKIQDAIEMIANFRGNLGATQNRIEYAIKRVVLERTNTQAAESRIRDTDMAKEMVKYTKNQLLQKTSISMLSQANQEGGRVLSLIGNKVRDNKE